ncbi:hypothetical protein LDX65_14070 [Acinetobacter baumannii]|uniref:hypothetical protein n=1 Tax=Acinetobacter baumannii TaxID=470 RepID=UPI001BCAFEED|nr:hypothetical protein [Acinetobacter baumannii]MCA4304394.1 hypothetical protein [Acinetobacter baumannii]
MDQIIAALAVIAKIIEVIMEKHGFKQVVGAIFIGLFIWQFSNILNAISNFIEVVR